MNRLKDDIYDYNRCFPQFLEIFLEKITITNLKFQNPKGVIYGIEGICSSIFIRFSNNLLRKINLKLLGSRLSMCEKHKKTEKKFFDKSGIHINTNNLLLQHFRQFFFTLSLK